MGTHSIRRMRDWLEGPAVRCSVRLPWALFALVWAIQLAPAASATPRSWNDGSSTWSTAANWTPNGAPVAGDVVSLIFSDGVNRTITYDVAATIDLASLTIDLTNPVGAATTTLNVAGTGIRLTADVEYIGNSGAGGSGGVGTLSQTAAGNTVNGDLFLGYNATDAGTYGLASGFALGQLTVGGNEYVGYSGTGTFNHTSGANIIAAGHMLAVGNNAGSTGTYNMSNVGLSTTLTANGAEYVGLSGTGTFTQSAGTNTAKAGLSLGYSGNTATGTYNLSGTGTLAVTGVEYVGFLGTGTFNQTGGAHTVSAGGSGGFVEIEGTASNPGAYNLSGGSLAVTGENIYVGYGRTGVFTHSGGTNTLSGGAALNLGGVANSQGTYTLSGTGSLTVNDNGYEDVGSGGTGIFNHSAGSNTTPRLFIGDNGGNGAYNLSGTGSLTVNGDEYIGYGGTGNFTQSGGTHTFMTPGPADAIFIGIATGGTATYTLNGGTLNVTGTENVGYATAATFNHSGGTHTVTAAPGISSALFLGRSTGSTGTYALGGTGALIVNVDEYVGGGGTGFFNQTGGTHTTNGGHFLYVDGPATAATPSTYTLGGGSLTANSTPTNGVHVIVGYNGTGIFNQSGGSLTIDTGGEVALGFEPGAHGTYNLTGGSLLLNGVTEVGLWGTGVFNQSGGTHTITGNYWLEVDGSSLGGAPAGSGTYNLSGSGSLSVTGDEYIGDLGTGTFNQSGGTHTATAQGHNLNLGVRAGSIGTYNLSGTGFLNTYSEYVGYKGTGVFNQTGGTHTPLILTLGAATGGVGTYSLSGGTLTGPDQDIGNSGAGGSNGTGTFDQSGGVNTVTPIGTGFHLGVNATDAGTYILRGGTLLSSAWEYVGYNGTGIFNHSAGTNTLNVPNFLFIGYGPGAKGTYNLSGTGALTANYEEDIGYNGTGIFNQSGGTHVLGGGYNVNIGATTSGSGAYNLSGGSAYMSGNVIVGGYGFTPGGAGVLNISGGSFTAFSDLIVFNTPGSAINLNGGTLNTGGLDTNGVPSLFNWTAGTLNITSDVTWDSAGQIVSTSAALGSSLAVGANQAFLITGNETLGGAGPFALTLNAGGTHSVTGRITLNPTGTLTRNPGSTLAYSSFTQAGGTFNGNLTNQGTFTYQSGPFNGQLLNQGLLVLNGGVVTGSGSVTNDYGGTFQARGTMNVPLTNNGAMTITGPLNLNSGAGNFGLIQGAGSVSGPVTNNSGGMIVANVPNTPLALSSVSNTAGGTMQVAPGAILNVTGPWTNAGSITLQGAGATFGGPGPITNSGTVQGAGQLSSTLLNVSGTVRASGGELDLSGAGNTNGTSGQIQASTGTTVVALQGLTTNGGTIALSGGAFDNNNQPIGNTGRILGSGTFRSGGLTNNGTVSFADAATSVFGPVTNNAGGRITLTSNTTTFFSPVTNNAGGVVKVTSGTARFLGTFTNGGTFTSDPADNFFSTLSVDGTGALVGGAGDRFFVSGDLINRSAAAGAWDTAAAELHFSGAATHTLTTPAVDRGGTYAGYDGNYAWGALQLAAGESLTIADADPESGGALYVRDLRLDGGLAQVSLLATETADVAIYYDAARSANAYLGGQSFSLSGGGQLIAAAPEPTAGGLFLVGGILLVRRPKRPSRAA